MKQSIKDFLTFVFLITGLNLLGPLAIFLPLPFFVFRDKIPLKSLVLASFIPVFLIFPFVDRLSFFASLLHYGSLVLPSLTIIFLYEHFNLTPFGRLSISVFSTLVFIVLLVFMARFNYGNSFFEQLFEMFTKQGGFKQSDIAYLKKVLSYTGIGLVFFSEAIFFVFNLILLPRVSVVFRDFYTFKANSYFVILTVVFIFIVNLFWMFDMFNPLLIQCATAIGSYLFFIFFVQGLSIYFVFLDRIMLEGFFKILALVVIFLYPMPVFVALAGILDFWIDFREKIKRINGGRVV